MILLKYRIFYRIWHFEHRVRSPRSAASQTDFSAIVSFYRSLVPSTRVQAVTNRRVVAKKMHFLHDCRWLQLADAHSHTITILLLFSFSHFHTIKLLHNYSIPPSLHYTYPLSHFQTYTLLLLQTFTLSDYHTITISHFA